MYPIRTNKHLPPPVIPPTGMSRRAVGLSALAAAFSSTIVGLFLRYAEGVPLVAERLAESFTRFLPLSVFSTMLATFGSSAKKVLLASMILLVVAFLTGVGILFMALRQWLIAHAQRLPAWLRASVARLNPLQPSLLEALPLAVLVWLLTIALVVYPLIASSGNVTVILVAEALPPVIFAGVYIRCLQWVPFQNSATTPAQGTSTTEAYSRRWLLQRGMIAVGVLAAGGAVVALLRNVLASAGPQLYVGNVPEKIIPPPIPNYTNFALAPGQAPDLTPVRDFYYVSKNLTTDPVIDPATWTLTIGGAVHQPYTLTLAQLQALPVVERYHTLECISNEVGGPYISTGYFRGTRLADILNAAGMQPGAREVIFKAADDYSDSLHLAQALDPLALVVYELDGAPLPTPHGFPARLLIPGLYGMKNGKWLTSLEVGTGSYTGFWEERGWTREAKIKTMARIDTPHDGSQFKARPTLISGVAFAAERGIAEVQVSLDAGRTWQPTVLRRPLGPLSWTLWQFPWTPMPGNYVLSVRAIELDGTVQQPDQAAPLPDGAAGYHAITVAVM